MKLKDRIAVVFMRAWRAYDRPIAQVIRPISAWNLPVGYTYDDSDVILDGNGAIVTNYAAYQTYDEIEIMPVGISESMRGMRDAQMVIMEGGVLNTGDTVIRTLPAYEALLRACWGVRIDTKVYRVLALTATPEGSVDKAYININLRSR